MNGTEPEMTTEKSASNGGAGFAEKAVNEIYEWVEVFVFAIVAVVLLFTFLFKVVTVEGPSMKNTLHAGEKLVISSLFYEPEYGDIIVIRTDYFEEPIIKRVIAVGGDTVDINFETWKVTVTHNGETKVLDEPYVNYQEGQMMISEGSAGNYPITLDENCVFVMGDNRNESSDSRIPDVGQINEDCIVGRVLTRIFPFNKIGMP